MIKFRLVSDEHYTIAQRYGAPKKKDLFSLIKRDDETVSSIILLDANEIVVCRSTDISRDTIKILSYYMKCITHETAIRIKSMQPKNDIFDWILQNDIICKNFAAQLSDGLENNSFMFGNIQQVMKSIEQGTDSPRRKNDGEDLGMIHLYQRYIMKRSPLGLPKQKYLNDKNKNTSPSSDTRMMRNELRKEAFLLYTEAKLFIKRHKTMIKCKSPLQLVNQKDE
jgi:hypothetical protein